MEEWNKIQEENIKEIRRLIRKEYAGTKREVELKNTLLDLEIAYNKLYKKGE